MTIREYLSQKFAAFNISEAQLLDATKEQGISLDDDVDVMMPNEIGLMTIGVLGDILLAPRLKSVSESGFSMSWYVDDAYKYYLYLCRKYGVAPNEEILSGLNTIVDKTSIW